MTAVEATVQIDAPATAVFAYMDKPANQPEITPSLVRAERLEGLPNGGKRVAYTYRIFGVDFEGELEATSYEPERRIRWAMTGDLQGAIEWTFTAHDGGTRVTYAAEYERLVPIVGWLLVPLVRWYNERELRQTLANLRARIETRSR
jgi:uncharacterized protein YndB with AHSA1/START domain